MKDRLITFALAAAAFVLFYALIAPKPAAPQERVTRPLSSEAGPNGYAALYRWLQEEGTPVEILRERYGELQRRFALADGSGHLLLSTAPHLYPVRASEIGPLRGWISGGNTLLLIAGLSDTPDWSMGAGYDERLLANMEAITGLKLEQAFEAESTEESVEDESDEETRAERMENALEALQKLAQAEHFTLVPNGEHPLLSGVQSVVAISEYPSSKWRATANSAAVVLELARDPDSQTPVLWLLQYGRGQIIVAAYGSLFTNKALGQQDNAQLLANLVAHSLGREGSVIIDDAHQGSVSFYDPDAFFGDTRLHRSLGWLLALWLVFVLGPQRLRAAPGRWQAVDITSFVRATGGFMARVLKPAAAGQQLFSSFFNDIRRRVGLPANGAPVWDWIQAHAAVSPHDLTQLRLLHAKVSHGRRVDLGKLHNLLVRVRHDSL